MINRIAISLSVVVIGLSFTGCDKIENPVIEYGVYRSELYGPAPTFTPADVALQNVLLEDFTGQQCGNCPQAHVIAKEIEENHEDRVAVVAIHAGTLSQPDPLFGYPDDWRTTEGAYYLLTQVGVDEMPKGRINREPGASTVFSPTVWAAKVSESLNSTADLNLQMNASVNEENQHLNVHVFSQWFNSLQGDYRLVIQVLESHILAPQLDYASNPQHIDEYEHNHMLRGTLTGATGLTIATDPASGNHRTDSYTVDWNSAWEIENCEVVAFVTEGENGRVINVTSQKLLP